MSNRIRFHLDEQVKSVIARELRRRKINVTTTGFSGEGRLWVQSRNLAPLINFLQPFRPTKNN